ncbi:SecY-interacting protein [Vibrio tritonius]|uniref:Protein Syd n=1 Tax=Vibrio tritonius TaxID=1435069 RepID=A0ABS7YFM2_9VIBR|nr:SecY-interacting protein [Vibrio tritonius]MCA2014475.1 SecY-interacting protein [Vibrio tritonius]
MASIDKALSLFCQRYVAQCQQQLGHLPADADLVGLASPCISETTAECVFWQPVQREQQADFSNVERAIELTLHEDVIAFYGSQYSADMPAVWHGQPLTLLQVWSDDDFERLQENILGHLVMQRRLKHKPTVFIAAAEDEMQVISVCNLTGQVLLETLGSGEREMLAPTLEVFLSQLEPNPSNTMV